MNNNELFEKYITPELTYIKHTCWKYWDKISEFDDLYNEILINIFRYIHTYTPSKPIRPWLYTIIKRMMLKMQKRRWNSRIDYVDLEQLPFSHIPTEEDECISDSILIVPTKSLEQTYSNVRY